MATSNQQRAMEFFAAVGRNDRTEILSFFADDAFYLNVPMDPVVGHDAIWSMLAIVLEQSSEVDWVVHHIAESRTGVVLTERTDRFLIGGTWVEYPVMGAMEFADGKITAWRDYFDLAQCSEQTHKHPRPARDERRAD